MSQDQFELQPYVDPVPKRKGRGASVKGAKVYIGIRIEQHILAFYNKFPNRQEAIRDALYQYYMNQEKPNANE